MSKIILTDKSYIEFTADKYILKIFNSYDKDGYPTYDNVKNHGTPFLLLEGSEQPIKELIRNLVDKIDVPNNKEWTILIPPYQISRDNLTSAQLTICPNCYPLNLKGAIWTIAQKFIPEGEYTPDSYIEAVHEAFIKIENTL